MGFLDGGLQAIFGQAFGAIYLNGLLTRYTRTEDSGGSITYSAPLTEAVKVQVDSVTESMRREPGYTDKDVRILMLQSGVVMIPNTDDEVTASGTRYKIASVSEDPARTHWDLRVTPA